MAGEGGNTEGASQQGQTSTARAAEDSLKRFLKREGGAAPLAPLTNTETDTPLQDTRDKAQTKTQGGSGR